MGHQALSWQHVAALVAVLSAVAIGVRFLWIFTATYGVRVLVPRLRRPDPASARISTLVSWSGMRGVVTLAAALASPTTLPGGEPFPQRDLVILMAFGIVFVTLVGQGLTLPALIKALDSRRTHPQIRNGGRGRGNAPRRDPGREQVGRLEHGLPAYDAVAVKRFFNSRSLHRRFRALPDSEARLWLGAAAAQREALLELWQQGDIGEDVLNVSSARSTLRKRASRATSKICAPA